MKAKKIAALLLASSMALSLVACGGKQATQTDSTSATEAEETAAAEDAAKLPQKSVLTLKTESSALWEMTKP